jgi:Zn-dependent M28 family amino/carboxypeptidase
MRRPVRRLTTLALTAFAGLLTSLPLAGQTPEIARLRAHAAFLSDDRLKGRETGSAEYDIAALYAATRFAEYGLEPGAGESYFQPVTFAESRVEGVSFTARRSGGSAELRNIDDYLMLGSVTSERIAVNAQVVFAGFGIHAPDLGVDDFAKVDVRGKVALIISGAPASFPSDLRAHHSSRRLKAELAERAGAVGLITLRERSEERRVAWERIAAHSDRPRTAWIHPDGTIADAFPGLAFAAILSRPGAAKLFEGTDLSYDALQEAADQRSYEPRALPIRVQVSGRAVQARVTSPNVAAVLRGSDPQLRDEFIVVSAHLDHVGVGKEVKGDAIHNGFFDNAIGSSVLLESARALAAAPSRPKRSVLFLLVTGEERGLLGSDYFAHHPTVPPESIVADVNVDMPLFFAPLADLVAFGGEHSTLGALAAEAAMAHGFVIAPDPVPEEVIFVRSDQYSFVRHGVPAIYLTSGNGTIGGGDAQAKGTAAFRASHYHRPSDEIELGADWPSVERFADTQTDLIRLIADAGSRPSWNPEDFFGVTFGGANAGR